MLGHNAPSMLGRSILALPGQENQLTHDVDDLYGS